jgi:protein-tyrosine phosphatase
MDSPARHIPLQGASNFRDLGGYVGHAGRRVRWRVLFRSDHLARLSTTDHDQVQALSIGRSFDFRGAQESQAESYALPHSRRHSLAIEPTLLQYLQAQVQAGRRVTAGDAADAMHATYQGFVRHNSDRFAELFTHLLAHNAPLVFHCTAGKDRTGLAAALILSALGVSHDDILQDYLLTNALYRHDPGATMALSPDVMAVVWRVQKGFLEAALQTIDADFGSMAQYLEVRLGLNLQAVDRLCELYLD